MAARAPHFLITFLGCPSLVLLGRALMESAAKRRSAILFMSSSDGGAAFDMVTSSLNKLDFPYIASALGAKKASSGSGTALRSPQDAGSEG